MTHKKSARRNHYKKFWKLGKREFNTQLFDISKEGELTVSEGHYQYNIHELAQRYGTPLRITFPFIIEQRVAHLMETFERAIGEYEYTGQFYYHYPMKVNQNRSFVLPLVSEGANLEITSANELWVVKRMWEQHRFNSRIKVICNGPKTRAYLDLIAELKENGLDIIPIIEDMHEREALKNFRGQVGVRVDLGVRVDSRWDKRINRFGLTIDELMSIGKIRNLTVLHYHAGSEIDRINDLVRPLRKAVEIYAKLKDTHPSLDTIDIGGGFSVNYTGKKKYRLQTAVERIVGTIEKVCSERGIQHPNIICEWGSHIAAPAQMTIFRVLAEKQIPKATAKKWYVVVGSFQAHLLDTWAIHRQWHVVPVNQLHSKKLSRVWLAGMSCDSDDKYTAGGSYMLLPRLEDLANDEDQYIAVLDTGSYQNAFTHHHCLNATPTHLVCHDGDVKVVRKRETPEEVGKLFGW